MQRKHWLICTSKYDKIAELLSSKKLKGNACEISSIIQCNGVLSGQALIGLNISPKNALSRHPLLPGHQAHPGGPCPPGIRTGISTNGKTVRGPKSSKMRQHRLGSQEVDPGTMKLEARFRTPSRKLSTSTHDRRHNFFCYRLPTTEKPQFLICSCFLDFTTQNLALHIHAASQSPNKPSYLTRALL